MSNPTPTYVLASDPGVEPPVENEQEKIDQLKAAMRKMQDRNFHKHRHAFRGTHMKTQGVVEGTLSVNDNLPAHLAQGLFSKPGPHPFILRYATEPSHILPDTTNAPRGIGIKVLGVDGRKMNDENPEQGGWHDLFANNAPVLELKDLDTTLEIITLREQHFESPTAYNASVLLRSDRMAQLAPGMLPVQHPISYTHYSQAAHAYGSYVAKFRYQPVLESMTSLSSTKPQSEDDYPSMLSSYFTSHPARYSVDVQLLQDLSKQSVEDTQAEWDEKEFPWQNVGYLDIPTGQDPSSDARRVFWEEKVHLGPFEGLEAHRPLGSVQRLRKQIYPASREYRTSRNVAPAFDKASIPFSEEVKSKLLV